MFPVLLFAQHKKMVFLSVKGYDNYYHTTNHNTYLGNTLRYGDGFCLSVEVQDTSKKSGGFVIDILGYGVDNYYKDILPNNQMLNVSDGFLMIDYLFKIVSLRGKLLSAGLNIGLGVSTLIERDYWDEYDNDLGYNNTYLKDEAKFGKNIGVMSVIETEAKLKIARRASLNLGIRGWGSPTGQLTNGNKLTYPAYTGSGFAFTLGIGFRL